MTSNIFGIAPPTLSQAMRKVCLVMSNVLGPQLVRFPSTKEGLEQSVFDQNGRFLDIDCSWPGSVHDA